MMQQLLCITPRCCGLTQVLSEGGDSLICRPGLGIPEQEKQTPLCCLAVFYVEAIDGRLLPVVLVGWEQQINKHIILSQRKHMLRNEYLVFRIFQHMKSSRCCVFVQGSQAVHLIEIIT